MTTYYSWGGSSVLAEYTESTGNGATFKIAKSYFYAGSRLLSTQTWNGTNETTEFHHPDRLGTKLVTNNAANTSYEQSTLPFGTALSAESSGFSNQVFTSYDRSSGTGLDYAVNRNYSSGQGRFTTVDPIGMASTDGSPQSLNLFAYVQNNPIDFVDPSGLDSEADEDTIIADPTTAPHWDWGWNTFLLHSLEFSRGPWVSFYEEGGGGGGGTTAPKKAPTISESLRKAVESCLLSLFGVQLVSFQVADRGTGQNGIVNLRYLNPDDRARNQGLSGFGVLTNVQFTVGSYISATGELPRGSAFMFPESRTTVTGFRFSPLTNFIIKDFESIPSFRDNAATMGAHRHPLSAFLGATDLTRQIHELGNSIAAHLGLEIGDKRKADPDSGEAFETCVRNELRTKRKK